MTTNPYRSLPSVDQLAQVRALADLKLPDEICVEAARQTLADAREQIAAGAPAPSPSALALDVSTRASSLVAPHLRALINATGVLIHTNLGRAPLSVEALSAAAAYSNLEYDLKQGRRGSRRDHVETLLCHLAGAEAALVVNNNAAALLLLLTTFAQNKEVLISRGELVEIGGSFRVPDIMAASGAILREVGTTNRTYERDYAAAVTEHTAAILKVHRSNFKVSGFVHEATSAEMVAVAREKGVPVFHDLGSASFGPLPEGLPMQGDVRKELEVGMDVVCFSGDKLLGGPQAGILVGRRDLIERLAKHPMARALRVDKFTLAALQHVLLAYRKQAFDEVLLSKLLNTRLEPLEVRGKALQARLAKLGVDVEVVPSRDPIGGGSHPEETLPGIALRLSPPSGVTRLAQALRRLEPAVIGVVHDGALHLHLRTVLENQEDALVQSLATALSD